MLLGDYCRKKKNSKFVIPQVSWRLEVKCENKNSRTTKQILESLNILSSLTALPSHAFCYVCAILQARARNENFFLPPKPKISLRVL